GRADRGSRPHCNQRIRRGHGSPRRAARRIRRSGTMGGPTAITGLGGEMGDLRGRGALLTGASGGIGQAIGRRLIAAGVRTAFAYGGRAAKAGRLVAESVAAGVPALALPGDMADPDVPRALLDTTEGELGPVDLLIANAGYAEP